MSAVPPAAIGHAIEVPDFLSAPHAESTSAEEIWSPGVMISGFIRKLSSSGPKGPADEKPVTSS